MAYKKLNWFERLIKLLFGDKQQLVDQNEEYRQILGDLELMNELERESTRKSDQIGAILMAQVLMAHYTCPDKMEEHLAHIVKLMPLDLRTATLTHLDGLRAAVEQELRRKQSHLRLVEKENPTDGRDPTTN